MYGMRLVSNCVINTLHKATVMNVYNKRLQLLLFSSPCQYTINSYIHTTLCNLKKRKTTLQPVKFREKNKSEIVNIWKNMTTQELSEVLGKDMKTLREILGFVDGGIGYLRKDQKIDDLQVSMAAVRRAGYRCNIIANPLEKKLLEEEDKDLVRRPPAAEEDLVKRPPVVTIMGHVDHGKTTLLDALRDSNIVDREFGGITQHIGAFSVKLETGEEVTFLDTPGHAAFSAMRERGAHVTDIVVLVVAADDGVMEQTKESIKFANNAGVPIIVAINKIDKGDADIDRTRKSLVAAGIQLEEEGGEVQGVEISALKKKNINTLIESLALQAEILDLKADPKGLVEGVVVESNMDPGRGKVATCIIERGTLRRGTILVAGNACGKVRIMLDEFGKTINEAPPSTPVQVIGWKDLPSAGDELLEVDGSISKAESVVKWRKQKLQMKKDEGDLEEIKAKIEVHVKSYKEAREKKLQQGYRWGWRRRTQVASNLPVEKNTHPTMSFVLKCDVDGSCEAILDILDTYQSNLCKLDLVSYGVGAATESDVTMAESFNGSVYTFNVPISPEIRKLAKQKNVPIVETNIIYRLIEHLKEDVSSHIPCKPTDFTLGEAVVLTEFLINDGRKKIPVAGSRCEKGSLRKDKSFKVFRQGEQIHEGTLSSLRHLKNEVQSINQGTECGIMFEDPLLRFENGDKIICYEVRNVTQETDWDPPGF